MPGLPSFSNGVGDSPSTHRGNMPESLKATVFSVPCDWPSAALAARRSANRTLPPAQAPTESSTPEGWKAVFLRDCLVLSLSVGTPKSMLEAKLVLVFSVPHGGPK